MKLWNYGLVNTLNSLPLKVMALAQAFSQGPSINWPIYFDSRKLPLCTHKTTSPSRRGGGTCPDLQDSHQPGRASLSFTPCGRQGGRSLSSTWHGWVNIFHNNPHTFPLPQRKTWPPGMINALFLCSPMRLSKRFLHIIFLD